MCEQKYQQNSLSLSLSFSAYNVPNYILADHTTTRSIIIIITCNAQVSKTEHVYNKNSD